MNYNIKCKHRTHYDLLPIVTTLTVQLSLIELEEKCALIMF